MQKLQGFAQAGDQQVTTAGQVSTTVVQGSFPLCTVTVYLQGTMTLASIFSNNTGTARSNPFTADANGNWFFYAANGRYDVAFSGTGIAAPFTLSDFLLFDPSGANLAILTGTHSQRIASFPPANYAAGSLFYETDTGAQFIDLVISSTFTWVQITKAPVALQGVMLIPVPGILGIGPSIAPLAFVELPSTLVQIRVEVKGSPLGANAVFTFQLASGSPFLTLTIPAGSTSADSGPISQAWAAQTDLITACTQVGTTYPGSDLTIGLFFD